MDKVVFFTGAGMSAESGLDTFRDQNGLWSKYRIEDVATPDAWNTNPAKVLNFYNLRRKQLRQAKPNLGHFAIAELERLFDIVVITQNVDDLHERAGSKNVCHLHGQLMFARTTGSTDFRLRIDNDLKLGDCCDQGFQLRPDVVWFGEEVPQMKTAIAALKDASFLVVVGTSLQVYPAAGLLNEAKNAKAIYVIDPKPDSLPALPESVIVIPKKANEGLQILKAQLLENA